MLHRPPSGNGKIARCVLCVLLVNRLEYPIVEKNELTAIAKAESSSKQRLAKLAHGIAATGLVMRDYVETVRLTAGPEYSVRIQHPPSSFYFPLGSDDLAIALGKALEIHDSVVSAGWKSTCETYPREITIAIFWSPSPLCCTYTTIYSAPNGIPDRWMRYPRHENLNCRTVIVHPEKGVREALRFWVDRQPGFYNIGEYGQIDECLNSPVGKRANLALVDKSLFAQPGAMNLRQVRSRLPGTNVFEFGVFEESNYIFHSVTGVKSGYILCRRQPAQLFEPLRSLGNRPKLQSDILEMEVQKFFKTLFQRETENPIATSGQNLTARERDVLLGFVRGLSEKEVAASLQISPLTVHNHVKRIYSKMEVHSRTEAVVKYLRAETLQ